MARDDTREGVERSLADIDARIDEATSGTDLKFELLDQRIDAAINRSMPQSLKDLETREQIEEKKQPIREGRARYKARFGEEPVLPQERRGPLTALIDYLSFGEFGLTSAVDEARSGGNLLDVGKAYLEGAKEPFTNRAHEEKTIEEQMRRDFSLEQGDLVRKIPGVGEYLPTTTSELGMHGISLSTAGIYEDPEIRKQRIEAMDIPQAAKSALNWAAALRPNQGGLMDIDDIAAVAFLTSVFTDPLGAISRGAKAVGKIGGTVVETAIPIVKKGGKAEMSTVAHRMAKEGEELIPISKKGQDRLYELAEETEEALRRRDPATVQAAARDGLEVTEAGAIQRVKEITSPDGAKSVTKTPIEGRELQDATARLAEERLIKEMGDDWTSSALAAPRELKVGIPFTSAKVPVGRLMRKARGKAAETFGETRAWQVLSDGQRFYDKVADKIGQTFIPGWAIRDLPGAKELFDMTRHAEENMGRRLINEMSREGSFRKLGRLGSKKSQQSWRRIYRALQDPEDVSSAVSNLPDDLRAAANDFMKWRGNIEELDSAMGTLAKSQRKKNYVPLFLRGGNNKAKTSIKAAGLGHKLKAPSDFYHHEIEAVFDTIEEVFKHNEYLKKNGFDELEPILDGVEVLARRMTNLSRAGAQRQMYHALKMQYGVTQADVIKKAFKEASDLVDAGHAPTGRVVQTARDVLGSWQKKPVAKFTDDLKTQPPEVKKEVLRQLLLDVDSATKQETFEKVMRGLIPAGKFGDDAADVLPALSKAHLPGHTSRRLGVKGTEYMVPDGLSHYLDGMENTAKNLEEMQGLLKGYDKFLNFSKIMLTLPFPAFHTVNVYSSMAMALVNMAGSFTNPARFARNYMKMLSGADEILETVSKRKYTGREVRAAMENLGVNMDVDDALQLTKLDEPVRRTGKATKALFSYGYYMSTKWENGMRRSLFVDRLQRGMSPADAATEVRKLMFDYGDMTAADRAVFRRVFPFWGWMKKSYMRTWGQLIEDPFKLSLQLRPFRKWSEDREGMVSYKENGLVLRTNRDGSTFEAIEGIKLQPLDFNSLDFGNWRKTALNLISMSAPPIAISAELISKRNLRGDYPLYRDKSQSLGLVMQGLKKSNPRTYKQLEQWLGYKQEAQGGKVVHTFNPTMLRLFSMLTFSSRIQSTTAQALAFDMGTEASSNVSRIVLGATAETLNVYDEKKRRIDEGARQMGELSIKAGTTKPRGQ